MTDRWKIEDETGAELTVRAPNGFAVELDANSADPRERFAYFAIRQQARDIESLRAELERAAAEPLFILTTGAIDSGGEQDDWDIECDSSSRLDAFCAAHPGAKVNLYTAPLPAPVAEWREPSDDECREMWSRCTDYDVDVRDKAGCGRAMFCAVRAVMGGEK